MRASGELGRGEQLESVGTLEGETGRVPVWLDVSRRHPYYVVAPPYVGTSAGIKVLHLLCHALNNMGERAFVVVRPTISKSPVHPGLRTPLLTKEVIEYDLKEGLMPIVVYAETVSGNPLGAPFVVRYVLNTPGLLGGDRDYPDEEFCVAYSQALADVVPRVQQTLFIPASDASIFRPPEHGIVRNGSCFYAAKYRQLGGALFDVTRDSVEITRDLPESPTPPEIADLFRRSELFYTYENTALAIEALLCGCPVVFLPNAFLQSIIGIAEHGMDGIAWGEDPQEIARAKATVSLARARYLHLYEESERGLVSLIARTQEAVQGRCYRNAVISYADSLTVSEALKRPFLHLWLRIRALEYYLRMDGARRVGSLLAQRLCVKLAQLRGRTFYGKP